MADFINVSTLNHLAKQVLEQCEPLNDVIVCGELSNFTRHYKSGHLYFSLKDENASVQGVMFRQKTRLLSFEPQNGMLVLAYGHATLYEHNGSFQLYVDYMKPFGAGAAQMAFDALYRKLDAEGLFDAARKRPLPAIPQCIGVVTSKTGAALQDVANILQRRWPQVKVLLAPVNVQGVEAESSIVAGIRALDADDRPDVLLVTRGGGSKEDLWVFNSERIARAAAACRKPVVSAVGHEIDTTILDYVADLRAPTPSAAAELCVPDREELRTKIFILEQNIQKNIQLRMQMCYNKLSTVGAQAQLAQKRENILRRNLRQLQEINTAIQGASHARCNAAQQQVQHAAALAASLNPYGVLSRGYAMVLDEHGTPRLPHTLAPGQQFVLRGERTEADCTVQAVRPISVGQEGNQL